MKPVFDWLQSHATAILGTAIVSAKAGLLGKVGAAIVTALAVACGVTV